MRRILRKIAEDEYSNLGDTSTLADPAVVNDLVDNRQNKKGGAAAKVVDGVQVEPDHLAFNATKLAVARVLQPS